MIKGQYWPFLFWSFFKNDSKKMYKIKRMELNYYDFLYESKMEHFFLKEGYFNVYDFGKEKDTSITLSSTDRNFKGCK